MVTFRNNNNNSSRRNSFRRNTRNFKSNGDNSKFTSNFSNNENFKRKAPGRNNHNAPKLIEKYNDLAREALSNGDKILSENYLQHADHFTRILNERESYKRERNSEEKSDEKGSEINDLSKDADVAEKNLKDKSNLDLNTETATEVNKFNPIIFSDLRTSNLILFVSNSFLSLPFNILPEGSFSF